jgi:hypothetical protein
VAISACPNLQRIWLKEAYVDPLRIVELRALRTLHAIVLHPAGLVESLSDHRPPDLKRVNLAPLAAPLSRSDSRRQAFLRLMKDSHLGQTCEIDSHIFSPLYMKGFFASGLPTSSL